jgi:hypothetical protein
MRQFWRSVRCDSIKTNVSASPRDLFREYRQQKTERAISQHDFYADNNFTQNMTFRIYVAKSECRVSHYREVKRCEAVKDLTIPCRIAE